MSTKIRIAARLRPRIQGEIEDDTVAIAKGEDGSSYVTVIHPRDHSQRFKFPFSSCYDQHSTQEEIFATDVRPLIDAVYNGVTVTVFAYGVTSSGKTHTMQGSNTEPGIIPRVVREIIGRNASIADTQVSLAVSYMEIYKEDAYDLLVDRDNAPKLPIRENETGQVFVANLSTQPLSSSKEFDKLYAAATKRRSTGATNFNRASSRSHAILTLYVQVTDQEAGLVRTGKVNLVDLAGSENNKFTGNDPSRMAESSAINKSLSVLGQVVHALNQGAPRIPYRNSKLTRILQDALGGSSIGLLVCNLAPGAKFRQDTWNTLNFAARTKEIENRPVANVREATGLPKTHFNFTFPKQTLSTGVPSWQSSAESSKPRSSSGRPSLLPTAAPSRLPAPTRGRISAFGAGSSMGFQPMIFQPGQSSQVTGSVPGSSSGQAHFGMTEEEINEKIAKVVEMEVARRLEEHEKRRQSGASTNSPQPETVFDSVQSIANTSQEQPSEVAVEQREDQQSVDNALERRLMDLEQKYEQNNKEMQLVDLLSPVSRKKTGRAYVALARAHSEKGNLTVALDLYHKAELYVPDNKKLKERILDIEYAVRNGAKFMHDPKKKERQRKDGHHKSTHQSSSKEPEGSDDANSDGIKPPLGEVTNSAKNHKRAGLDLGKDTETPQKRQKMDNSEMDQEDWNPANAPAKKGRNLLDV